jgi:hypothetical protein
MTYMIGSAILGLLSSAAGVLIYRWRTRVDLDANMERRVGDAQAIPLQLLRDELCKRETELSQVRAQDQRERDEYVKTLTAISGAMSQIAEDLKALRQEEREGRGKVYERMEVMDKRLLVIETKMGQA